MYFFRPGEDYWVGDIIPFYWEGVYHIFYLKDRMHHGLPGGQHIWAHISTKDFLHWEEYPIAVPLGETGQVDSASCGTGSVFQHDGQFHIFYLGRYYNTKGETQETVCHSISKDLINWEKDASNPISLPNTMHYSSKHWRDPYVFWNAEAKEFWMLITAELKHGPEGKKGCIALLTSTDLEKWEPGGNFWAPYLEFQHECPDLFYWNGWWYLIYSVGGHKFRTYYRMSRNLNGPWKSAAIDAFDDFFVYAAKSAGNEDRRMLFGFVASKYGEKDSGKWDWAGNLSICELVQETDGTLWVKYPEEHIVKSVKKQELSCDSFFGSWNTDANKLKNHWSDGFSYATIKNINPNSQIRIKFIPEPGTRACGIYLRTDNNLSTGYQLRFDFASNRVTLGYIKDELIRSCVSQILPPNLDKYDCIITMEGSIIRCFIAEKLVLTGRFYEHKGTTCVLFCEEGSTAFEEISFEPGDSSLTHSLL
jgi:beta-fructofuranosidase